jgi:hypothetical protein
MSKSTKVLITVIVIFLGISALAAGSLPFSFKAGDPIKADEVNANFTALAEGKQNVITNSPCSDGQFVTGVDGNGKLSCGIDQIGSAGSSGVSSLNGKTGSLAIEGGDGVMVETSEDGKVTISTAASTGGDLSTQATIEIPSSGIGNFGGAAFKITNTRTVITTSALNGVSKGGIGVLGTSTTGKGVVGTSTGNTGVEGQTSLAQGTAVAGINTNANGGTGVSGTTNGTYGFGVRGEHKGLGYGVYGTAPQVAVGGESATGIGVKGIAPIAMYAQGNTVQPLGFNGWAKAMIFLDSNGTIARCYNGTTGSSSGGCGFSAVGSSGYYVINLGFETNNRFYSTSCVGSYKCDIRINPVGGNQIEVYNFSGGGPMGDVSLIVF